MPDGMKGGHTLAEISDFNSRVSAGPLLLQREAGHNCQRGPRYA